MRTLYQPVCGSPADLQLIDLPTGAYLSALTRGGVHGIVGGARGALLRYLVMGRGSARKQGEILKLVEQRTTLADLDALFRMAVRGEAKPLVDAVYPLDETAKAFERFGAGVFVGKLGVKRV